MPVEAVAVAHEQALALRGAMDPLAMHFELAAQEFGKHRQARIVIARECR